MRGSRHAQKSCPSEGHCREHWLKETHVSQQHQGPSKGHFNPSEYQAGRVRVGHTEIQQSCVIRKPMDLVTRDAGG